MLPLVHQIDQSVVKKKSDNIIESMYAYFAKTLYRLLDFNKNVTYHNADPCLVYFNICMQGFFTAFTTR